MITTIIILSVLLFLFVIYSIIITLGLIRGLNKIEFYEEWIEAFKNKTLDSYNRMKDIDTLGAFESDDDTGFIFSELLSIITDLNSFTSNTEV